MLGQGMTQKEVENAPDPAGCRPVHAFEDGSGVIAGFFAVHRRDVRSKIKYAAHG